MRVERTRFPHRQNRDGSYDSICPRCYRTISNRKTEAELAKDEFRHICDDWHLDHAHLTERSRALLE
jgi:hypothetical protein